MYIYVFLYNSQHHNLQIVKFISWQDVSNVYSIIFIEIAAKFTLLWQVYNREFTNAFGKWGVYGTYINMYHCLSIHVQQIGTAEQKEG